MQHAADNARPEFRCLPSASDIDNLEQELDQRLLEEAAN